VRRLQALLASRELELTLTPAARRLVAERGYDPTFGARPLKRAIQRHVQDPLAQRLLAGEIRPGDQIEADVEGGEIVFRRVGHKATSHEHEAALISAAVH